MLDKVCASAAESLAGMQDGSVVLVSGFGEVGVPATLLQAVLETGATDLTIVANNAGVGESGIAQLIRYRRVRRVICSYPRSKGSVWFEKRYREGVLELELVPQGTLAERLRAAGSGLGPFYTPVSVGTELAEGKEVRRFGDRDYVLEEPLHGDWALVGAEQADRWGNVTYRGATRNFGPCMTMAARTSVIEVERVVALGKLRPEDVHTPGVFVDRVVCRER